MIPSLGLFIDGFNLLALARGAKDVPAAGDLADVLGEVARLAAGEERSEPAAFFYAVARRPVAMGDLWSIFPVMLARNHASRLGRRLRATDDDLADLRMAIHLEGLSFEVVRDWFEACMEAGGAR